MLKIVCTPPSKNGENKLKYVHPPLDVFDTFPRGISKCLKMPILTKIYTQNLDQFLSFFVTTPTVTSTQPNLTTFEVGLTK